MSNHTTRPAQKFRAGPTEQAAKVTALVRAGFEIVRIEQRDPYDTPAVVVRWPCIKAGCQTHHDHHVYYDGSVYTPDAPRELRTVDPSAPREAYVQHVVPGTSGRRIV